MKILVKRTKSEGARKRAKGQEVPDSPMEKLPVAKAAKRPKKREEKEKTQDSTSISSALATATNSEDSSVSITLEKRRALPVLGMSPVDAERERKKLKTLPPITCT